MQIKLPEKLKPFWEPARYKIAYGGRGSAKSWSFAKMFLAMGTANKIQVLCTREFQNSIKDSVHRLLKEQIDEMGLHDYYRVDIDKIVGTNGTRFFFVGLAHNTKKIKSYEGVDYVWVEEGATVTKESWEVLIPTIRKAHSEIWVSFNPELSTDETYQRFVLSPPEDSIVIQMNWRDNPWFPKVLEQEMKSLKERDPVAWRNVWEGECRQAVDGAVFGDEILEAEKNKRITKIPYDKTKVVNTFWDIGYRDQTAIWFVQKSGFNYHFINYIQNSFKGLGFYLDTLQSMGYVFGEHYLPHDGGKKEFGLGKTVEEMMEAVGFRTVVVPRGRKADGIKVAQMLFNQCLFDNKKCFDGIQCLRRYRYGVTGRDPIHDEFSHGADAYRTFAMATAVDWENVQIFEQFTPQFLDDYDPLEDKEQLLLQDVTSVN